MRSAEPVPGSCFVQRRTFVCPVCSPISGIVLKATCPACQGRLSLFEEAYGMVTQFGAALNPKYKGPRDKLYVVAVNRYRQMLLERDFTEYSVRWICSNQSTNKAVVSSTIALKPEDEFPWDTLPIYSLAGRSLEAGDNFYVYVSNKPPNVERRHLGQKNIGKNIRTSEIQRTYSRNASGKVLRFVSLRDMFGTGDAPYKKQISQGISSLCSGWIDGRILEQLKIMSTGDVMLATNIEGDGNIQADDVDLFGDEEAFYGEYNPLSIAVLTRYEPACQEVLGLCSKASQVAQTYQQRIDTSRPPISSVTERPAVIHTTSAYEDENRHCWGSEMYGYGYTRVEPRELKAAGYFHMGKQEGELEPLDEIFFEWREE